MSAPSPVPGPTRDCGWLDLHLHSCASDGVLTPTALMERAAGAGLRAVALTDHDTVRGLAEARAAAEAHGLALIDASELSCTLAGENVHVVGLGIDPDTPALLDLLADIARRRSARAERIAERLAAAGVRDPLARCRELTGHDGLTRTHFARLLVADGVARDMRSAFRRHLADGRAAAGRIDWPDCTEAVAAIHAAGGIAVLAHPLRYGGTHARRERTLAAFAAAGGDAAEISTAAPIDTARGRIVAACRRLGLAASAGSDFHDPNQRWIRLGGLPPLPPDLTPVWALPAWPMPMPPA